MYNIKVARGNVVNAAVEAIVTPANNNLMPGQGISKMVFYSAGKKLIEACSRLKYCETGSTVVTSGYNLPAQYIIHAVGPWWHGGYAGEAEKLASTYLSIIYCFINIFFFFSYISWYIKINHQQPAGHCYRFSSWFKPPRIQITLSSR